MVLPLLGVDKMLYWFLGYSPPLLRYVSTTMCLFIYIMLKQNKCYHKENIRNFIKPYIQIPWIYLFF